MQIRTPEVIVSEEIHIGQENNANPWDREIMNFENIISVVVAIKELINGNWQIKTGLVKTVAIVTSFRKPTGKTNKNGREQYKCHGQRKENVAVKSKGCRQDEFRQNRPGWEREENAGQGHNIHHYF